MIARTVHCPQIQSYGGLWKNLTGDYLWNIYVPQARDVKKKPHAGGIIALKTDHRDEYRQKAEMMMQATCKPQKFSVLEEGEIVTGQETKTVGNESNRDDSRYTAWNLFGIPVVSGQASGKESQQSSTTTQTKEWQISYACDSSAKAQK